MRTEELEAVLRDAAADQPAVKSDLTSIVRRVRDRRRRRRGAAMGMIAVTVIVAVGGWLLLPAGDQDTDLATSASEEPGTEAPTSQTSAPADDPLLDEYRAGVAATVHCLEDLGYYVIGPWPHPDCTQYGYSYGLHEGSATPELKAEAERCYEAREHAAHNAIGMRQSQRPLVALQTELLDVLSCIRPQLEGVPDVPSTLPEVQALDSTAAALLSAEVERVLSDVVRDRSPESEGIQSCLREASALPT